MNTHITVLKLSLTPISLSIEPLEVEGQNPNQDDIQAGASETGIQSGSVKGRVLGPEDQTTGDTTDTAEANQGRATEGSLPLAADVIRLVGHGGWDVGVCSGRDEEDTKVACRSALGKAHDGETDDAQQHVDDNDGTTVPVLVTVPSQAEHDETSKRIRWCHETLRRADVEAHALREDDGQEVCEGVGDGGGVEEYQSVYPDLPVATSAEETLQVEGKDLGVATVCLYTSTDPGLFSLAQERPGLPLAVGKINQKPVARNTEEARQDALDDEDPAPTG